MSDQLVPVLLAGAGTGLGLIVAIGAQNAWVLRQGIRREHIGTVIALCALADIALIAVGTAGIGALAAAAPWLLTVLRWGGVVYLILFALRSFRSAVRPGRLEAQAPASARSVVLTTLALAFLNPHVYLDTVLMVGGVANQFGQLRWAFAAGAMLASAVWFTTLGLGARALAGVLDRPSTWRLLDAGVGIVMLLVAAKLAFGV